MLETTAWGAARLAGMHAGVYPAARREGLRRVEQTFTPRRRSRRATRSTPAGCARSTACGRSASGTRYFFFHAAFAIATQRSTGRLATMSPIASSSSRSARAKRMHAFPMSSPLARGSEGVAQLLLLLRVGIYWHEVQGERVLVHGERGVPERLLVVGVRVHGERNGPADHSVRRALDVAGGHAPTNHVEHPGDLAPAIVGESREQLDLPPWRRVVVTGSHHASRLRRGAVAGVWRARWLDEQRCTSSTATGRCSTPFGTTSSSPGPSSRRGREAG